MVFSQREVFNKVRTHLLTQKAVSMTTVDGVSVCVYRGKDGTKCAIGCLISDANYYPDLEGQGAADHDVKTVLELEGIIFDRDKQMQKMLVRLQQLHDDYGVETWPAALAALEREFFPEV